MNNATTYICSVCGKEHLDWPAIAWDSPTQYDVLSAEDKERIGKLGSDICTIEHPDQTDRFIRCTLHQPVIEHSETLDYGVWVSLSDKSFNDYLEHYSEDHETQFFGWLCVNIPPYDETLNVPTMVRTRSNGERPYVVPHEDHDHPFVRDFYEGISFAEATRRVHEVLDIVSSRENQHPK